MCGRFALYSPYPKLSEALRLPLESHELTPRYNVAPGTWITAVRHPGDEAPLVMDEIWWGYRPHWAKESAPEPINATVEKVAISNYFRGAFAHHRCVMPADGWYEWLSVDGKKRPHFLCRSDREPIWLAGICSERPDGKPGCAIVTEPARGDTIRQLVHHLPAEMLTHWPVTIRVNRPGNDDASLIAPLPAG